MRTRIVLTWTKLRHYFSLKTTTLPLFSPPWRTLSPEQRTNLRARFSPLVALRPQIQRRAHLLLAKLVSHVTARPAWPTQTDVSPARAATKPINPWTKNNNNGSSLQVSVIFHPYFLPSCPLISSKSFTMLAIRALRRIGVSIPSRSSSPSPPDDNTRSRYEPSKSLWDLTNCLEG